MNGLDNAILTLVTFVPAAGALLLLVFPRRDRDIRLFALVISLLTFVLSLHLPAHFHRDQTGFQTNEQRQSDYPGERGEEPTAQHLAARGSGQDGKYGRSLRRHEPNWQVATVRYRLFKNGAHDFSLLSDRTSATDRVITSFRKCESAHRFPIGDQNIASMRPQTFPQAKLPLLHKEEQSHYEHHTVTNQRSDRGAVDTKPRQKYQQSRKLLMSLKKHPKQPQPHKPRQHPNQT